MPLYKKGDAEGHGAIKVLDQPLRSLSGFFEILGRNVRDVLGEIRISVVHEGDDEREAVVSLVGVSNAVV
ncbi:hypothetical protein D9M70_577010 [compost metagenome]